MILGDQGMVGYGVKLKKMEFTSLNYHDRVHLGVNTRHESLPSVNRKTIGVVMEIHKSLHLRQVTITG